MKFVQNKCNKSIVNLYNNDFLCNSVANNVLYMCSELLCPDGVLQPWFDVIDQGQDHIITNVAFIQKRPAGVLQ